MKKKIPAVLLLLLMLSLVLGGCKPSGESNAPDTDGESTVGTDNCAPSTEDVIYSAEAPLHIVTGRGFLSPLAYELQDAVCLETDVTAAVSASLPEGDPGHTIYLGRVENELSQKAYDRLEEITAAAELASGGAKMHVGYVYCVSGTSMAVAYSDDMYGAMMQASVQRLIDDFIKGKDSLKLDDGFAVSECYSYIDFLKEADGKYYEKAWNKLLEVSGNAELVESLKKLKTLYSSKAVSWLANLYDGEIGGFYYSNSGRDNQGFLPDADSTYQAVVLVSHMGMKGDFGYGNGQYSPEFLRKMGIFAKGLQDENGFFYHPQWPKELVDSKLSRRARDLVRAQALIRMAGLNPTYNTPDGGKGDGLVWDAERGMFVPLTSLVKPLGMSTAPSAASGLPLSTASGAPYVPEHIKTEEALRAYLQAFLDAGKNFYSINNELANQTSQFRERDRQLEGAGASWRVAPIIIEFLNEHQNAENGTWSTATDYNAVDGLFKAAHIYTDLGYQIPNAMAAAMTALEAITSSQETSHICNIYNCWCTLQMVMRNMKQFGAPADAEIVLNEVRKAASPSIRATYEKYLKYQKEDKSFSYYKDRCSAESQGMQVAIQCNEGDMNATSLTYSVWGTIFDCLGYSECEIPLHGSADFASFLAMIEERGGIVKKAAPQPKVITFDDEKEGVTSTAVTYKLVSPGASAVVKKDPRPGASGNVLEFSSYPGGGDNVFVAADSFSLGTCFIFEGEFCIADSLKGYIMQINLGPSAYMLNIKLVDAVDENGEAYQKVQILEASSQGSPRIERDLGVSARLGEWFKIRFEYYLGSHDSVRIKVYFNDTLAAVSDNYYDHKGEKITKGIGSPQKYYSYTQMNVMSSHTATILMDNLFAAKTDDRYTPEHDPANQPLINCDPPVRD